MKNNKNYQVLVLVVSIICLMLACYFIGLDREKGINESIFNIFISVINVMVMSILTYLIYEINKKSVDVAEKNNDISINSLEITRQANNTNKLLNKVTNIKLVNEERRKAGHMVSVLNSYRNALDDLFLFSYPHLTILEKRNMLIRNIEVGKFSKNKSRMFFVIDNISLNDVPSIENLGYYQLYDIDNEEDKNEDYKKIEELFYGCLPNILRYKKISDLIKSIEKLLSIKNDTFIQQYHKEFIFINDIINKLESHFLYEIKGLNSDMYYTEVKYNKFYANSIKQLSEVINMKLNDIEMKITEEQNKIERILHEID